MITFRVKADVKKLERQLDDVAKRQVPFAQARAVTEVAKRVQKAETAALPQVFDRPTPFTMNAFAVKGATKANPSAVVYAKPIQAEYLAPSEFGSVQHVAKVAVLRPVDIPLNQYGNIPRGALKRALKRVSAGQAFIGKLTFKRSGETIGGVWLRPTKRNPHVTLLVRFADPVVVKTHLGFAARAEKIVRAEIGPELLKQLNAALASAR